MPTVAAASFTTTRVCGDALDMGYRLALLMHLEAGLCPECGDPLERSDLFLDTGFGVCPRGHGGWRVEPIKTYDVWADEWRTVEWITHVQWDEQPQEERCPEQETRSTN